MFEWFCKTQTDIEICAWVGWEEVKGVSKWECDLVAVRLAEQEGCSRLDAWFSSGLGRLIFHPGRGELRPEPPFTATHWHCLFRRRARERKTGGEEGRGGCDRDNSRSQLSEAYPPLHSFTPLFTSLTTVRAHVAPMGAACFLTTVVLFLSACLTLGLSGSLCELRRRA